MKCNFVKLDYVFTVFKYTTEYIVFRFRMFWGVFGGGGSPSIEQREIEREKRRERETEKERQRGERQRTEWIIECSIE